MQDERTRQGRFETLALPHLDAAYNLARWLTRNDADAEDLVQDAVLRALRYFDRCRGDNPRAWLLAIVRNAYYDRARRSPVVSQEDLASDCDAQDDGEWAADPLLLLERAETANAVNHSLASLPDEFREALVLRELEGLSYREIADVTGAPIGTVMSRLARARALFWRRMARKG